MEIGYANAMTLVETNAGGSIGSKGSLKAVVSGSFHRHLQAVGQAIHDLRLAGVQVLSPGDPRAVAQIDDFVFIASDPVHSIKEVEDRHLDCIRVADFLWVVCPDGHTGASTCLEIGTAVGAGVPIFSQTAAADTTITHYVSVIASVSDAISALQKR